MSAWIMFVVGCLFAVLGVCTLGGWRVVLRAFPNRSGWGALAMGGGFAADGLPRIAGWSDSVSLAFATAGLALIVLGVMITWLDNAALRKRHGNAT